MDGPSTRGGKRGRKKVNMQPTETGGQIYMSEDYANKYRDKGGSTELDELMRKKLTERMHAGEMTPKQAGLMSADTFIEQLEEAYRQKRARKKPIQKEKGGAAKGYMGGGKVRGYKDGGGVCRGGGAAVGGTKFIGVK